MDYLTVLFLVSISLFSAFFAVFVLGQENLFKNPSKRMRIQTSQLSGNPAKTIFVFKGTRLVNATPSALMYVGAPVDRNAVWTTLISKLDHGFPNVAKHFQALADLGLDFERSNGKHHGISGKVRNGKLVVEIFQNAIGEAAVSVEHKAITAQFEELVFLREVCDLSHNLVWQVASDGTVQWANPAYIDLLTKLDPENPPNTPPYRMVLESNDLDSTAFRRKSLTLPGNQTSQWFETNSLSQADGNILNFAFRADHVVQAEEALRNFVQTLTKTFAHLPIGLAIFDRDRKLALFNPALADLKDLSPTWLTARPTLTAFLDRLRENRHVPEHKNYKSWRDRIQALERAAEDGTYEENWPLPTGQTYRVTGRPHPEGAVAFLFEDITSSISLQREFRGELELGQSVLDCQVDAIAVFAANGDLVMSNDAFSDLWGIDPREVLSRLGITEAVTMWQSACDATSVWDELLDFAKRSTDRSTLKVEITMTSGGALTLSVKPLVQGSFICEFAQKPSAEVSVQKISLARA
ncbi:MAG: PAS domain-containing protein [Paracoccaceae bacterium]